MIAPLLRVENKCHVEECERVLKKAKKFDELVLLYHNKGIHKKGKQEANYYLYYVHLYFIFIMLGFFPTLRRAKWPHACNFIEK